MRFFLITFTVLGFGIMRAPGLDEAWKNATLAKLPPKTEVRAFLAAGLDELKAEPDGVDKALFRVNAILDRWEKEPPEKAKEPAKGSIHAPPSMRKDFTDDFFSQDDLFTLLSRLNEKGALTPELKNQGYALAKASLTPEERGANNRAYHFALARLYAARLYPDAPEAKQWAAFAEAVWQDFYAQGDTYEPGYVTHDLPFVIELGTQLGHQSDLTGPKIKPMFERFRNHVSPSGLVIDPGDGGNQSANVDWLTAYAALSHDGTYLWALDRVLSAGDTGGYDGKVKPRPSAEEAQASLAKATSDLTASGLTPTMSDAHSGVEYMFPETFRLAERLILNTSRAEGHPFAAFYLNDTAETLQHAHEDNRGELYHYEVDGVMYLKRSGWYKWAALTNTFVVGDATVEFPWNQSTGLTQGHWYRGDANIRLVRMNQATADWARKTAPGELPPWSLQLWDTKAGLGFRDDNPLGLSGAMDQFPLQDVTLSINSFPLKDGGKDRADNNFPASIEWYRDFRANAPSGGPIVVRLANLRLTGAAGEQVLETLDKIPDHLQLRFFPAGKEKPTADEVTVPRDKFSDYVRVVHDDATKRSYLEATCPPGRLDLVWGGFKETIDLTKQYSRLGFDYAFQSDPSKFLRTPIAVFLNGLRPRSVYIDKQQGGIFQSANTEEHGGDAFGEMHYNGVYTSDSTWSRKAVLTQEGVLVVVDEYLPGKSADGMLGGPVWQLPTQPKSGDHWFASEVEPYQHKSLLVYLGGSPGTQYGSQPQDKGWIPKGNFGEFAAYSKQTLHAGSPARFVSVMLPFDSAQNPADLAKGIGTSIGGDGTISVTVKKTNAQTSVPLQITIAKDSWAVSRSN